MMCVAHTLSPWLKENNSGTGTIYNNKQFMMFRIPKGKIHPEKFEHKERGEMPPSINLLDHQSACL